MQIPFYQIDSFTSTPFRGNPAAVCLLERMLPDSMLLEMAAENNLSETAFVMGGANEFKLRWWTPVVEVDLCGHATLAAAHALREAGLVSGREPIAFDTISGRHFASFQGDLIELDFPKTPACKCDPPRLLIEGLGVQPEFCGKTRFDYLVQVAHAGQVTTCRPDLQKLRDFGARGVMITARSDDADFDFISRFFAPGAGIDEDPVTGSAHCALAPFWQTRLGKAELVGYQASARGGIVRAKVAGDRVYLTGNAVTVISGTMHL